MRKIVLTPIKNEAWILNEFLHITSKFADLIIIADQFSTDESLKICSRFPKVTVIKNESKEYNERDRQQLLINAAREIFPNEKRILFALDADEIIDSSGITSPDWDLISQADEGTTLYFEKPELIENTNFCVRWKTSYFPLAYVDDNSAHYEAVVVHSKRVPSSIPEKKLEIHGIKFMHFALTRKRVQEAKFRFYSVQENILKTRNLRGRRHWYKLPFAVREYVKSGSIEPTPESWFAGYGELKNLRSLNEPVYSWHDFEVLTIFKKFGEKRFYLDNIWDFDWEECRKFAVAQGILDLSEFSIKTPPKMYAMVGKIIDWSFKFYLKVKSRLKN